MLYPLPSAPYSEPVLPASAATASAVNTKPANTAASASAPSSASSSDSSGPPLWSHGGFSFKDLLDIVNPLQHIPVVGSVYRYLTGDEPSGGARIVGDSIYGGPIGFGVSVVSTAFLTNSKGQDLGERVLADVFGPRDGGTTLSTPAIAANTNANPAATSGSPTASNQSAGGLPLAQVPAQPVAMNNLFRSPPANSPATPEQSFLAQNAQFQKEITQGRGANGAVINGRPVPLELSSNLLPTIPAGAHIVMPPSAQAAPAPAATPSPAPAAGSQAPAIANQAPASQTSAAATVPTTNPIAQKMLDALNKYEQLKKQEEQQDSATQADSSKVDLSL